MQGASLRVCHTANTRKKKEDENTINLKALRKFAKMNKNFLVLKKLIENVSTIKPFFSVNISIIITVYRRMPS